MIEITIRQLSEHVYHLPDAENYYRYLRDEPIRVPVESVKKGTQFIVFRVHMERGAYIWATETPLKITRN